MRKIRTQLEFTDEEIDRIATKIAEKLDENEMDSLKYGLIRTFGAFDLWFEPLTEKKMDLFYE